MRAILFLTVIYFLGVSFSALGQKSSLEGKIICVDPGHGGTAATDSFRVGPKGEREEWINLRVALQLKTMLEEKGAKVIMTRTNDVFVPLDARADSARNGNADFFLSIHHNATADRTVNFPIIYYHGAAAENEASGNFGKHLAASLRKNFYKTKTPVTLVSDHTIFPAAGAAVLRNSYGIPGVLAEASFFSHPKEEKRLKKTKYNRREAKAFLVALEQYFADSAHTIETKYLPFMITPFEVLQEADRMQPDALKWKQNYDEAVTLMAQTDSLSVRKAYDLFTSSARAFPDSYVAEQCHRYRAQLLQRMGRRMDAAEELTRANQYYINVNE